MQNRTFLIIYGAAVKPGGVPSGTLLRRVQGAWRINQNLNSEVFFMVTGGEGKYLPTEAEVMQKTLLELGATKDHIILETQATDTMESTFFCTALLSDHGYDPKHDQIIICSSPYHNYRCQLLLRMLGIPSIRGKMPSDRKALGEVKWLRYYLREMLAIPWDLMHIWMKRKF